MLSITISSPSWTADPSVLASFIALSGTLLVWAIGRIAAAIGRATGLR